MLKDVPNYINQRISHLINDYNQAKRKRSLTQNYKEKSKLFVNQQIAWASISELRLLKEVINKKSNYSWEKADYMTDQEFLSAKSICSQFFHKIIVRKALCSTKEECLDCWQEHLNIVNRTDREIQFRYLENEGKDFVDYQIDLHLQKI